MLAMTALQSTSVLNMTASSHLDLVERPVKRLVRRFKWDEDIFTLLQESGLSFADAEGYLVKGAGFLIGELVGWWSGGVPFVGGTAGLVIGGFCKRTVQKPRQERELKHVISLLVGKAQLRGEEHV